SSTLKQLASTDANATEVTNMADVNSRFQEIAEQLNTQINLQNVAIRIPGLSNGTRVRFTFDRVSSASSSKLYIEGVFNLRSRTLTDVEYHGMTSTSGSIVTGVSDGIFVTFNFNGIQTTDNSMLSKNNIKEWYYTSSSTWQINSEFDPDQQPDIQTESSSALIMLVLDCSSSLGSQFSTAKSNAKSFINTLYSSYGNSSSGAIPGVYEYVDLGLSVKWATCNVGATKPEEYGDYFAWGETEPYYEAGYAQESPQAHWKDGKTFGYTWTNYKFRTSGNSYDNVKFSKYNTSSSYGPIDNNTTLDLEDDVAHVQWGGTWRMPTKAEQDDLRSKCTWTWYSSGNTEFNGVAGYQVTSKIEGYADRFIFLPAAGYRYDTYLYGVGSLGYYWSSSLYTDRPYSACFIGFGSEIHGTSYGSRYGGQSVRPVCP
ncbi:MAG: hypothetical protein J6P66_07015, partial [Bacteroidaceae bacterium]|nr:hypothetical protein [Bacteroidaceae bacterium]